jgi:hypothetical protein
MPAPKGAGIVVSAPREERAESVAQQPLVKDLRLNFAQGTDHADNGGRHGRRQTEQQKRSG